MQNLEKEIREQPVVLGHVIDDNMATLKEIVSQAKERGLSSIYFVARGTSDHACIYAQYIFGILAGIPCTLGTPSVFTKYGATISLKNTLVIGVSQSGRAEDCLTVLKSANKEGALTVALTNNLESPMAKEAKYHLYCNAGPEISIAATKTFTSQAALLGAMAAVWAGNEWFLGALKELPTYADAFLMNLPGTIDSLASELKEINGAIVLGRGVSYPIALEGALKMLETNKLSMKGYAASDFHHGPVAQIKKGDVVFLLAPYGVCYDDAAEMALKLAGIGANLYVLTNEGNREIEEIPYGKKIVLPYTGTELTAPFMEVMFFQLLACKMTEVRHIDPDQAGVINKITITK